MMRVPTRVLAALRREPEFLIATHINPDGDAIGSALALSLALESAGKKTFVYCRDRIPPVYRFLPKHKRFKTDLGKVGGSGQMLILLDCNSPERAAIDGVRFERTMIIDHHETESGYGDIRWIDNKSAATGLMVYYLIKALGVAMTRDIALNLFTAISIDTGTFRYSNTSSEVLRAAAELVEYGVEPDFIANSIYDNWTRSRFSLLVMALNTLQIRNDVASMYITRDMFRRTGTSAEDTENFANYPRMIDSVKVAAVFRELENGGWKVSLRSKGNINVAEIAEAFGGGGHRNAAGFTLNAELKTAEHALQRVSRKKPEKS